ncbi:MAG: hypothetical protein HQK79_21995 [Desulfobacterales bacterium]|nr:hypothetical protein [Desulfobacterales bacterium]
MEKMQILIEFSKSISKEDRESLLLDLKEYLELTEIKVKQFNVDWISVIGALKDGAAIVGGLYSIINIAYKIITWRNAMKTKNKSCNARIKIPESSIIDLDACKDQEIIDIFTQRK